MSRQRYYTSATCPFPPPAPPRTTSNLRPYATPPAQRTADGVTVQPDDPRITVAPLPVAGADNAPLISYYARPRGEAAGGIVVVHENAGHTTHIKDVVRRIATAGFSALSVDLLSRKGGIDKFSDPAQYAAAVSKKDTAAMVSDAQQALSALSASGVGAKLGIIGFCFGGGVLWNTLAAGTAVEAAVPFYGPAPQNLAGLATAKAAVFAIYGERDVRITSTRDQVEAQLSRDGHPYRIKVYPGANHAFHNDTGARYDPVQAETAWIDTIDWLQQYVH